MISYITKLESIVITNVTKGIFGYFVDAASSYKINTICIPHGTLTKNFDEFDAIYKETIAEGVTSKNALQYLPIKYI